MKFYTILCLIPCLYLAFANTDEDTSTTPIRYTITHEAWFDIGITDMKGSTDYYKKGRIVIGLFGDVCPMTVTNFVQLTRGFKRDKAC